jgi:excisionase family DNA binding protein
MNRRCDTTDTPPALLQPELYRIRDAAVVLAVSPRMIYAFIEAGALRAVRLPSTGSKRSPVRIARVDLLAFVDRHRGVSG